MASVERARIHLLASTPLSMGKFIYPAVPKRPLVWTPPPAPRQLQCPPPQAISWVPSVNYFSLAHSRHLVHVKVYFFSALYLWDMFLYFHHCFMSAPQRRLSLKHFISVQLIRHIKKCLQYWMIASREGFGCEMFLLSWRAWEKPRGWEWMLQSLTPGLLVVLVLFW